MSAANSIDPERFVAQVFEARKDFIRRIIERDPKQKKFYKGWMNRLAELR